MPLITELGRHSQAFGNQFKASLVTERVSGEPGMQRETTSQKQQQQQQQPRQAVGGNK